jgi:MFS family permease
MKDRTEDAQRVLTRYHANDVPNHPLVELEVREIIASLRDEPPVTEWKTFFDLRQLVKTRGRRYRLALNVTFAWFSQFSGNNVISYYLPSLLKNVGITSTNLKLLLNIIYAIVGWIFSTAGANCHDRIGRRKMFLISTMGMVICLAITAGTAADFDNTGNKSSSSASIAFIYVFGAVFSFAYTSMQPIYPTEIISNDARAKGVMCYKLTGGASGFLNTFVTPIALENVSTSPSFKSSGPRAH